MSDKKALQHSIMSRYILSSNRRHQNLILNLHKKLLLIFYIAIVDIIRLKLIVTITVVLLYFVIAFNILSFVFLGKNQTEFNARFNTRWLSFEVIDRIVQVSDSKPYSICYDSLHNHGYLSLIRANLGINK
uniref:Uncharacterized protein n=1 Tax=Octopus bimaculoides TaxID=37653 RepID=A0A0L8GEH5_OCTBM